MVTATDDRRDNRTIDVYVQDTLALLKLRNTKDEKLNKHSLRSWVYKISEDINSRQKSKTNQLRKDLVYWTVSARDKYAGSTANDFKGLHLEHPVPRGKIVRWLCDLPTPEVAHVIRAIDLFLISCWVTTSSGVDYQNSEECALNREKYDEKESGRIKDSMPHDWCFLHGDPWDRYRYVLSLPDSRLSDLIDTQINLRGPIVTTCLCQPDSPNRLC